MSDLLLLILLFLSLTIYIIFLYKIINFVNGCINKLLEILNKKEDL